MCKGRADFYSRQTRFLDRWMRAGSRRKRAACGLRRFRFVCRHDGFLGRPLPVRWQNLPLETVPGGAVMEQQLGLFALADLKELSKLAASGGGTEWWLSDDIAERREGTLRSA